MTQGSQTRLGLNYHRCFPAHLAIPPRPSTFWAELSDSNSWQSKRVSHFFAVGSLDPVATAPGTDTQKASFRFEDPSKRFAALSLGFAALSLGFAALSLGFATSSKALAKLSTAFAGFSNVFAKPYIAILTANKVRETPDFC